MRRRKQEGSGIEPTLPITPMLDMAFQLLFFFVVTYNPSDLEGQMDLSLPSEQVAQAKNEKDVDPLSKPDKNQSLELPADVTVIVNTARDGVHDGAINALHIEERSGQIHPNYDEKLEQLKAELLKIRERVENKDAIKIQGDSKLKWVEVVRVMDACRKAGFQNISFVPPPDFRLGVQ
jgi:biopolymer transport protein ExbD